MKKISQKKLVALSLAATLSTATFSAAFATDLLNDAAQVPHPFESQVREPELVAPYPLNVAALLTNAETENEEETPLPPPNENLQEVTQNEGWKPAQNEILTPENTSPLIFIDPLLPINPQTKTPTPVPYVAPAQLLPPSQQPQQLAPNSVPHIPLEQFIMPETENSQQKNARQENPRLRNPNFTNSPKANYSRPTMRHYGTHLINSHFCDACGFLTCENKHRNSFFFDGWLQHGVSLNGRERTTNEPLRFTDQGNEYAFNQLYLTFGRSINRKRDRIDFGFRGDILFGSDYFWTSALGLETRTHTTTTFGKFTTLDPRTADGRWNVGSGSRGDGDLDRIRYGLSLPQFYGELFLPFASGLTIKAGHFYSEFGLESVMAPQNQFYSHSYSFMYGSPLTITGGTLTQKLGKRLSVTAGITRGWDIWDNPLNDFSFLLGTTWKYAETGTELSWMLHSGRNTEIVGHNEARTGYVLAWKQQFSQGLRLGLEHTLGYEKDGSFYRATLGAPEYRDSQWASIASVIDARITPRLSAGFRGEWFCDDAYGRIPGLTPLSPTDTISGANYYAITAGVRWQPHRIVTVRPEIRYDWSDIRKTTATETHGVFNGRNDQLTTSLDMILRF